MCFRTSSRDVLRDETTKSGSFQQTGIHTRSDGDWSPIQRCFIHSYDEHLHVPLQRRQLFNLCLSSIPLFSPGNSRPSSPKSDSELMTKPSDADNQNPTMHWAWGELPQAATVRKPSTTLYSRAGFGLFLSVVYVLSSSLLFPAVLPPSEIRPPPSLPSIHPCV